MQDSCTLSHLERRTTIESTLPRYQNPRTDQKGNSDVAFPIS